MTNPDILIIGGGPAGLSAALHLHKNAPHLASRILILEKARYPRSKLCAGGLVLDAEMILEQLGLDVREVPHVNVDKIHFDFEGRGLDVRVPGQHALRVIRRDEFDNWLAHKVREIGIEIREQVTVRNVIPDQEGVTVETDQGTFRAQVVVGADGSNGITRRCILPDAPVYTARVLELLTPEPHVIARRSDAREISETRIEDQTDEAIPVAQTRIASGKNIPRNDAHRKDQAYFDFFPVPDNIAGYTWDFPTQINGEAMRCWGIYDTNILADEARPALKESLAKEMSRHGFDLNQYEIKGHPIRWFSPDNQMSVRRVLLVGDTVGADPIFGEGISIALGYGAVAAREIAESIRRNEFSFSGYKYRVLRSALGQTLIARWFISQVIYPLKWRWFQILLWRIMKPFVILGAWIFVLNWGRRLKT